jgi:hypothetical protein
MLIEPITPAGKDWLEENLQQERTTFGRCIAAEPRFVPAIVEGAQGRRPGGRMTRTQYQTLVIELNTAYRLLEPNTYAASAASAALLRARQQLVRMGRPAA